MDLQGKIVMVTGATNGVGEISAYELARKGAHIVVVGRNPAKCDRVVEKIKAEGNSAESMVADLSSMDQVRDLATMFLAKHDRLHVLMNNAGAFFVNRKESVDGYEMTFALNHLNYFLLTNLLLDTIIRTGEQDGEARIVNVSSNAHYGARGIDFDNLQLENGFSGWGAYNRSKLMNVMFTYELARRLEGTNVTANVLHPGFVRTGFARNNDGLIAWGTKVIQNLFAKSPEDGARTQIYLASSPAVQGVSGQYFEESKPKESNKASQDVAAQKRLWEVSEQLTGLKEAVTA